MIDNLLDYEPPADALKHKRILITGAADGIGRAVSKRFASHGASLILLDKKTRKLETLYDDIVAAGGPEPALVVQDLMDLDHESALKIGIGIEQDFQGLDGLLHNAGQLNGLTPMHSVDNNDWQQTLQVNLIAPWMLTQVMLPLMKRSAGGPTPLPMAGLKFWLRPGPTKWNRTPRSGSTPSTRVRCRHRCAGYLIRGRCRVRSGPLRKLPPPTYT
jgi:NAD(P)-dependent dehydrogenase (short-subunit alcohol dehydrogenase family)